MLSWEIRPSLSSNRGLTVYRWLGISGVGLSLNFAFNWNREGEYYEWCLWTLVVSHELARNVVLLEFIAEGTSAEDVVAKWANHALTDSQRAHLDRVLEKLASSLPDWLVFPEEPGCDLAAWLLEAFTSWRGCTMTLQELDKLHTQSISVPITVEGPLSIRRSGRLCPRCSWTHPLEQGL